MTSDHEESGFTLIEIMVTIVITGFVVGAIAAAMTAAFGTYPANAARLTLSNDAQLLSSWLESDVLSARSLNALSGATGCNDHTATSPPSTSTDVLNLAWSDADTGVQFVADYRREGSELVRYYCSNGPPSGSLPPLDLQAPNRYVVGRDLDPNLASPVTVRTSIQRVTLLVNTVFNKSPYSYSVSASRRTNGVVSISLVTITGTIAHLSGCAPTNAKVMVTATDGATRLGPFPAIVKNGSVCPPDNWSISIDLASLNIGTVVFDVVVSDSSGTALGSAAATAKNPVPVVITNGPPPLIGSTTTRVTLGGTAEMGASVTVRASDGTQAETSQPVIAGGSGKWSATLDVKELNDGTITFTAQSKNGAGDIANSTSKTSTKDTVSPVPVVTASSPSPTGQEPLKYSVTFSKPVGKLDPTKITVSTPSGGQPKVQVQAVDSTHALLLVTGLRTDGTDDGDITLTLSAGAAFDAAANPSQASNSASIIWKSPPQGLTIQVVQGPGHSAQFSGTAGHAPGDSGTVKIVLCATQTFPCPSPGQTLPSIPVDPGSGAWQTSSGNLGNGNSYYADLIQTDYVGNISHVVSGTFTT